MPRKSKQKKKTKSNCREKTKGTGKLLYSESESGNHDGPASDHETRENKCLVMQTGDSLSREESPSTSNRNDRVGCKSDEEAHDGSHGTNINVGTDNTFPNLLLSVKEEQEKENATIERERLTEESVEDFSGTTSSEVESRSDRKTVKDKNLDRPDDNISANPIVKLVPLEKDELEETVVKRKKKKKKKKKKKAESEESVKEICKGSDCTSETSYTVDNGEVAKDIDKPSSPSNEEKSSAILSEDEILNQNERSGHESDVNDEEPVSEETEDVNLDYIKQSITEDEPLEVAEEKNFTCLLRLLQVVGANTLRKYFCSIHPYWSNKPIDACNLDKGLLKLEKQQEQMFNSGNIKQWDVSLLIRVLRFSKRSSLELKKHPDIDKALKEVRDIRNNLIAHASSARLSKSNFEVQWNLLKANLIILGAKEEDVDGTLEDYSSLIGEQYLSGFLEEIHRGLFREQEIRKDAEQKKCEDNQASRKLDSAHWGTWKTFIERANNFSPSLSHFVLIVDAMPEEDLQNFKVLSAIPWKMVLDFNPSSEDDGFHSLYTTQSALQFLVSPWTPGQIKHITSTHLPKQIDRQRTQWLFVNGRKQDREDYQPRSFPEWEHFSKKQISRFFACCSEDDKFDNQKPITCILLPIAEISEPYADVTLRRLQENFEDFSLNFLCFDQSSYKALPWIKEKLVEFPLTSQQVKQGIESTFSLSSNVPNYQMPTSQAGVSLSLTPRTYAYLSEHLQLLYKGCENETFNLDCDEDERDKIAEEHRRSFMSGNLISFASLYFNHDAKRVIEDDIQVHIQRMLCQPLKHSVIVEIMHSPGTGGSTIARRVLWNLHKSFPCVVAKLPVQCDFDEFDTTFIRKLCERISSLEDECGIPVLVLVDDLHHWRILGVTNRIVRTLNAAGKRSVVLQCLHNVEPEKQRSSSHNVHKVFSVHSRLEDIPADLKEFRVKYKEYLKSESTARRVFHFPLLSMIQEFRPKLQAIVSSTLEELNDLEKDVATFVAFLQLYAGQSTPALLLYEAFKFQFEMKEVKPVTYDSIRKRFTDNLLNLMVRENPRSRIDSPSECFERYTLQHIDVAQLVFEKHLDTTKQTLFNFVDSFLDHKVLRLDKFLSLYCNLLLYHKGGHRELRFSLLFDTLGNSNERKAAEIFYKAAAKVADPRVFGNAARFFAKMAKPNFEKAKKLVMEGLKISKTKGRTQSIQESKGVVLCIELKNKVGRSKIKSIEHLQQLAEAAIYAFRAARDFPPTFHGPLIGEVEVWLECIGWIVKSCCEGDEEKTVKYLSSSAPSFFRTCVGDCYTLLDRVDEIIRSSTTIPDPEKAQEHSQRVRCSLVRTTRPKGNKLQSSRRLTEDICNTLVSGRKLPPDSEKLIKRYKVWTLLSLFRDQQIDKPEDLQYLVKLLEEMVVIEKDHSFARHLLRICPQISGSRSYDLQQAMKISNAWLAAEEYDPMPYFYSMVISFIQIINGAGPSGYYGTYQDMLRKLRERSRNHCKRTEATHFLGKSGRGMSQLVSRAFLFMGQGYQSDNSEAVTSFWTVESRQKLKECVGRVRVKVEGKSEVTTVELLQGGVELHVKKNSGIGKPGKDFDKDTKVYFVVSFNLGGPVANGITFEPFQ